MKIKKRKGAAHYYRCSPPFDASTTCINRTFSHWFGTNPTKSRTSLKRHSKITNKIRHGIQMDTRNDKIGG